MNFHYFGGRFNHNQIDMLEDSLFSGVMFTYNPLQGDFFTKVARDIKLDKKIKYMIAIRAHTLSPQYLCMINYAINDIMPERLQINLLSGHIKPDEVDFGGLIDSVTDHSSNIDRSNYLIKYLEELNSMSKNPKIKVPDFYVTTSNKYVFETTSRLNQKMLVMYNTYVNRKWTEYVGHEPHLGDSFSLKNKKVMIVMCPIIRDSWEDIDKEFPLQPVMLPGGVQGMTRSKKTDDSFFTKNQFRELMLKLESENIHEVMVHGRTEEERARIIDFIKDYKKKYG